MAGLTECIVEGVTVKQHLTIPALNLYSLTVLLIMGIMVNFNLMRLQGIFQINCITGEMEIIELPLFSLNLFFDTIVFPWFFKHCHYSFLSM